jgi:hypothetical protein
MIASADETNYFAEATWNCAPPLEFEKFVVHPASKGKTIVIEI